MKKRVAGIMRVKNEGPFIHDCIESCIDALDELIVVYNDCTDNSVEEIEKMARKYPDKIRYYAYPYEVRVYNLSREEFMEMKAWPEDNPHLFCSYSNFALSKVTADFAMLIDADQIYFSDKLKALLDFVRDCENIRFKRHKLVIGKIFRYWVSAYLTYSRKVGLMLPMMPKWLARSAYPYYLEYAKWEFANDKSCISLSGVNVFEPDETLISMAHSHPEGFNVMPSPFNGVGDHLVFRMSNKVKFRKYLPDEVIPINRKIFCLVEEFVHPYKRLAYFGFFWKHIRTMRFRDKDMVLEAYKLDNDAFLSIDDFKRLSYHKILQHAQKHIFLPYNRILFGFVYKANKKDLFNSLEREGLGGAIKKQSKA
jgi:hypothetical protein